MAQYLKTEKRIEYKSLCTSRELNEIFNFFGNDLKQIFSRRLIESLYFDTLDFSLYKEKELYDVNTKTVRFRKYNNEDTLYKEIKFNSFDGKYKKRHKTNFKSLKDVTPFAYSGKVLYPSLFTKYKRDYFESKTFRMTIDSEIIFSSHTFRDLNDKRVPFRLKIVEFKFLDDNRVDDFIDKVPVPLSGFSKFKEANKSLYFKT